MDTVSNLNNGGAGFKSLSLLSSTNYFPSSLFTKLLTFIRLYIFSFLLPCLSSGLMLDSFVADGKGVSEATKGLPMVIYKNETLLFLPF